MATEILKNYIFSDCLHLHQYLSWQITSFNNTALNRIIVEYWFLDGFYTNSNCPIAVFFTQVPTVPLLTFYTSPNCLLAFFQNLNCPFSVFLHNPNSSLANFLHKLNSPFAVFLLHKPYSLFANFFHKKHFYCHFARFAEGVLSHYP